MSTIKRIPWWGWGLAVAGLATIGNLGNYAYGFYLDDVMLLFISGAAIYVPIAGVIALIARALKGNPNPSGEQPVQLELLPRQRAQPQGWTAEAMAADRRRR